MSDGVTDPGAPPPGVREHDVRAGELTMRVAEAGTGSPVVLIHGNFASRRWFYEQLAAPPPGLRLLAPDLPNFGASPPLPAGEIRLEAYADALVALLDALEVPRAVLVGHSLGAAVAERACVARPSRVAGLMLVDGAPPQGLPRPEAHYELLAGLQGRRDALEAALGPLCPTRTPPTWPALLDDALAMAPAAFDGNARALGRSVLPPVPDDFDAPVLVLRGGQDVLITDEMAQATARHWPGAELVTWTDVGHAPPVEAPTRFTALLAEFAEAAMP
ncbi:MAG: alpha/beta hydrolase [Trueperaceae bacterium]|nr:alpha/beta hydrolase [Trueperaceae bacterium]